MDCHCTDDKKLKDNKTEGVLRMKIVRVNTYTVRPRWGFVEIITDDGLTAGESQCWKATARRFWRAWRR